LKAVKGWFEYQSHAVESMRKKEEREKEGN